MSGSSKVIDCLLLCLMGAWGTLACQSSPQGAPPVANGARVESASTAGSEVAAAPAPLNQFDGDSFSLRWTTTSGPVVLGQTGQGQLVLTAKPPFKCNQEYPFKLKLTSGGLEPTKAEFTKADMQVTQEQVTVPVTFVATKPGDAVLDANFAFSVCTDDKCLIERQPLRLGAEVVPSK